MLHIFGTVIKKKKVIILGIIYILLLILVILAGKAKMKLQNRSPSQTPVPSQQNRFLSPKIPPRKPKHPPAAILPLILHPFYKRLPPQQKQKQRAADTGQYVSYPASRLDR